MTAVRWANFDFGRGGSAPAPTQPVWLLGKPLNTWIDVGASTNGAGGAVVDAFSGMAVAGTRLIIAAAGGHFNSPDNRVVELDLAADSPAWVTRIAASVSYQANVRRYSPDNMPTARHTYATQHYVPAIDRVVVVGCNYAYGGVNAYAAVDAYDVTNHTWDAPLTFPDVPEGDGSAKAGVAFDGTYIWSNTLRRLDPVARTWSNPITTRVSGTDAPQPLAYDSTRAQLFGITCRTGTLIATRTPVAGTQEFNVTFNASAALTQFQADQGWYAGMHYDPLNDCFWWYAGQTFDTSGGLISNVPGRVYQIKPANSGPWDISLPTISGTVPPNPPSDGSGVNNRWRYVAPLKGFAYQPNRTSNLYFIRTA